jgi:hypothetical protein
VAFGTLINSVALCQGEKIMIYTWSGPLKSIYFMTFNTVGRKSGLFVFRIGGGLILRLMATKAII